MSLVSLGRIVSSGSRLVMVHRLRRWSCLPRTMHSEFCFFACDSQAQPHRSTPTELLYQLKDSGAKLIFVSPALLPTLLKALELGAPSYTIPQYRIILMCQPSEKPADTPYSCIQDLWNKAGRPKEMQSDEERDTAYLCYSSGTTGRAKGVETSHHNMTSQVQAIRNAHHTMRASDAILGVLPFGHIYGLTFLLHHPLTVHAPVIVLPRFDVDNVLKAIEKVCS
jgi:long-subunit acyl-CoA synthetase (AMP-forming)